MTNEPGRRPTHSYGTGREIYQAAHGAVDDSLLQRLRGVGVATVWSVLTKAGIAHPVMRDVRLLSGIGTTPMIGRARTLRYLPLREDLLPTLREVGTTRNPQRALFETINPGDVVVIDAGGETGAGGLGDILATRLKYRGCAGLVTDGSVRDAPFLAHMGMAVFTRDVHPGANTSALLPYEFDAPVQCGRVAVFPGDVIIGDQDGVVVVPAALAERVAAEGHEQEALEAYLRVCVENGESLSDAYPPGPRIRAAYEAQRGGTGSGA